MLKSIGKILIMLFFCLLSVVKCEANFAGVATNSVQPNLSAPHPRLLLTLERQKYLRESLETTHKFLWKRYQQDIPGMVGISQRTLPIDDERYDGDIAVELAFAWHMNKDEKMLQIAKNHLLRLTDDKAWQAKESLIFLINSHFLLGIALAYDWLYPELTREQRLQVSSRLGKEAEAQYQAIVKERIWWRNQYFQNHSHSNTCALAFAAAALYGEDERASKWLEVCKIFFDKVFEVLPKDGSSMEGYAYAGYGGEYILKYALLSQELLDKDYTASLWMKNYTDYMLHGLLPYCTSQEWALTFGDAPRRGWTSTAQHLFTLARLYHNPVAQWMGKFTMNLYPKGLGNNGWMMMIYYDPTVEEADPKTFPTFKYFPEVDQVMMRSSWIDQDATLIGYKCGPFMGKTLSKNAIFDFGTGHSHTDSGSFQIFSHGQFLAIDPLYNGYKLASQHNTMLFKGTGQMGEQAGFGSAEALYFKQYPEILQADHTPQYDYVVSDVSKAYHPALGLKRYMRQLLFIHPNILLVADDTQLDSNGVVYNYASEEIETAGDFKHGENDYVVGTNGEGYINFEGETGTYQITSIYLDNVPGVGNYSIVVDGKTVHSWKSHNEEVDDHLIAVTPPVELKKGSKVAFYAAPMSEGTRLIKMAIFSYQVAAPVKAEWIIHFDPNTEINQKTSYVEASLGKASLDLYCLAPKKSSIHWNLFKVLKAEVEPFTFRKTKQLIIEPSFTGNTTTLLTLMHTRANDGIPLKGVKAKLVGKTAIIHWSENQKRFSLKWNLEKRKVNLISK